jgi:hypothetical protein
MRDTLVFDDNKNVKRTLGEISDAVAEMALEKVCAAQQSIYLIALWCWFGASFLLNIVLLIVLAYIIG